VSVSVPVGHGLEVTTVLAPWRASRRAG